MRYGQSGGIGYIASSFGLDIKIGWWLADDYRLEQFQASVARRTIWSRPVATAKNRSRRVNSIRLKSLRDRATVGPFWE